MKKITDTISQATYIRTDVMRKIVMTGFCVLAVLVGLYVYFVGSIVFDVVARRSAETLVLRESGDVATLEAEYYQKTKGFDLEHARTLGFSESTSILYAKRNVATVGMLTHGF